MAGRLKIGLCSNFGYGRSNLVWVRLFVVIIIEIIGHHGDRAAGGTGGATP